MNFIVPKILFITLPERKMHEIAAESGNSLMEIAVKNGINRIIGECGGACACATCHVYIDEAWLDKTGVPDMMEEDMLDFALDVRENSRLACQIRITDELDGLVVFVPPRQV